MSDVVSAEIDAAFSAVRAYLDATLAGWQRGMIKDDAVRVICAVAVAAVDRARAAYAQTPATPSQVQQ